MNSSADIYGEVGRRGFPDRLPDVAAFADLMTAALEAVMAQQYLRRLQLHPKDLGQ